MICTDIILTSSSIIISPANPSILVGNTQQFSVACYDQNGNPITCPSAPTWSVTDTNIGSITDTGLFTAIAPGTITVHASIGSVTGSTLVTTHSLSSISISPTTPTIIIGNTLQFSAICQDQDSNVIICPSAPTWSVTDESKGTITNTGLFTATTSGTVTIQATIGLITGNTLATISPAAQAGFGTAGMILVGGLVVGALYYMAIKSPHIQS